MFVLNDDLSIYATRGDIVFFTVTAEENGELYTFKAGDVVRIKVYGKKDAKTVVLEKDFPVTADNETVEIFLSGEETKFGDVISKPKDYWYEVELNPMSNPQTIIGYDEDGAKIFKLFPEGKDLEEYIPDSEDIPFVDTELDIVSPRPVQNQAVARAIVQLKAAYAKTDAQTNDTADKLANTQAQVNLLVAGETPGADELVNIRVGADNKTYDTAGDAVREQIKSIYMRSKEMTYCNDLLRLNGYYEPQLTFTNHYFNSDSGVLVESNIRAITNYIYCPNGAIVDIVCADGYSVSNTGNYNEHGIYIGSGPDFTGMIFRRYVVRKSDDSTISTDEAAANITVTVVAPRTITEDRANVLLRGFADVTVGKNLLNKSKSSFGYIKDIYGRLAAPNDSYYTSEFIPIEAGGSIAISPRIRKLLAYDENFNPIANSLIDAETANYIHTAEKKGFVRFTYYANDDNVQAEYGTAVTEYVPFETVLNGNVRIKGVSDQSALHNKVGLSFGDSIMYGAGNGGIGILDILNERYGIAVYDYSVSGASVQNISGRKFVGDQIFKAVSDGVVPDFILLDGLSNDIVHGTLGEMSDNFNYSSNGYATFSTGLEYCIGLIKDSYPDVPLIYVIPHSSAGRDYAAELNFGDRARDICKKWSVPVADVYKDGNMTARLSKQLQKFTYYPAETSGTHPNENGYDYAYIPIIVDMLNKILK